MRPSDLSLRELVAGDVSAITDIYAHYVRHSVATFDLEAPEAAAMSEKFAHISELGHPLIVADVGGKVAGYAYASIYRARPAYRFACEDSVYLAPDAVGQGIGSALLDEVIVRARAFGFRQMIAVIAEGTDASIRLHEKHGFKVLGRFPDLGFKFDRWIGVIHMQRPL